MEETKQTPNNEKLKHALCYVPLVAAIFFFTENKKSEEFMKHIKYGTALFFIYLILFLFLGSFMPGILTIIYVGVTVYFGYKTYNGEEVEIEYFDKAEEKIKDSFENTNKK